MPYYTFDVKAHYHTDPIFADTEQEARLIANAELQYNGEEYDTTITLIDVEED